MTDLYKISGKVVKTDDTTLTANSSGNLETIRASDVEAIAGSDTNKALTPASGMALVVDQINQHLTNALIYRGSWAITTSTTDYSGLNSYRPIKAGDYFRVTGTGPATIDGVEYNPNDSIIFNQACSATTTITTAMIDHQDHTDSSDTVYETATQTLTNKTIDADDNTISNLETDNFKSGVVVTTLGPSSGSGAATNTEIPTALAVRSAIESAIPDTSKIVMTDSTQTITGNKTFTGDVVVPTTTDDVGTSLDAVNVKYLYDNGYADIRSGKANTDLNNLTATGEAHFQTPLVSGTNIKTINGSSVLGSGDLTVTATITGGASTIVTDNLTASKALVSNSNGKVATSSVTNTELEYLSGVTSAIQTQINDKANKDLSNLTTLGNDKFVTKDTAQTISGVKTFTANPTINGGNGGGQLTLKNNVTTYGTSAVNLLATTNNSMNQFLVHFQEGNKWVGNWSQNPTTKNVTFSVAGCSESYAPTPTETISTSSAQIATVGWCNTRKQDTITGAATTIASSNLTASKALVSNSSGKVAVSSVTLTELGYVSGVTSAIQTQLNAKQATLVSRTNIKSINGKSILGSGNLTVIATVTYCTTKATTTSTASSSNPCVIVENYKNGTEWYRVWSDGWIEQGGYITNIPSGITGLSVTFSKAFTDTNYFSVPSWGSSDYAALSLIAIDRTTTGMKIANRTNVTQYCYWYACGY